MFSSHSFITLNKTQQRRISSLSESVSCVNIVKTWFKHRLLVSSLVLYPLFQLKHISLVLESVFLEVIGERTQIALTEMKNKTGGGGGPPTHQCTPPQERFNCNKEDCSYKNKSS